jgi:hypothetical protein
MTARAVGREVLKEKLKLTAPASIIKRGADGIHEIVAKRSSNSGEPSDPLRPKTRWNIEKILKFRHRNASMEFSKKAEHYIVNHTILSACWSIDLRVWRIISWLLQWLFGLFMTRWRRKTHRIDHHVRKPDKLFLGRLKVLYILRKASLEIANRWYQEGLYWLWDPCLDGSTKTRKTIILSHNAILQLFEILWSGHDMYDRHTYSSNILSIHGLTIASYVQNIFKLYYRLKSGQ